VSSLFPAARGPAWFRFSRSHWNRATVRGGIIMMVLPG